MRETAKLVTPPTPTTEEGSHEQAAQSVPELDATLPGATPPDSHPIRGTDPVQPVEALDAGAARAAHPLASAPAVKTAALLPLLSFDTIVSDPLPPAAWCVEP